MLSLSAYSLLSIPTALQVLVTAIGSGGVAVVLPAILLIARSFKALAFLINSSWPVDHTLYTRHILVIRDGNKRAAILCCFIAHSLISLSIIASTLIKSLQTRSYKSTNCSCDTVVVCVVSINRDFKKFTKTLATSVRSTRLTTWPSSLAYGRPSTVRVFNIRFYVLSIKLATSLEYSHSILEGKLYKELKGRGSFLPKCFADLAPACCRQIPWLKVAWGPLNVGRNLPIPALLQ